MRRPIFDCVSSFWKVHRMLLVDENLEPKQAFSVLASLMQLLGTKADDEELAGYQRWYENAVTHNTCYPNEIKHREI